jgi:hypothetical protein
MEANNLIAGPDKPEQQVIDIVKFLKTNPVLDKT